MRYLAAIAAASLTMVIAGVALAEEGQHGNLKMTTTFEMSESAPSEMAGMDEPMVMLGEVWLTEARMRMDMDSGMGYKQITIMDLNANEMYTLDPTTKTAYRIDVGEYQEMAGAFGGDFTNPANMFKDWDSYVEMLEQIPGLTYEELGEKTINGQQCKGLSFVLDMAKMMENVDTAEMPGGEMMGTMGDYTGEFWFSEAVRMMPVYMTGRMDMMGMKMDMRWELLDVEPWIATDDVFAIPEGYTVTDFSSAFPMPGEEESNGEEAAPAPAA